MAVNRDSFYTNGINRRESTHPYRIPFALLVNLGMKKILLGFIYFFYLYLQLPKNSFDIGSKRNLLEGEMKQGGANHIFLKSTGQG